MAEAALLAQELRELRLVARDVCEGGAGDAEVRRLMEADTGWDPTTWQRLADGDLLGLHVPSEHGGSGAGLAALCAVAEEFGRSLLPSPFLGTVALGATALALADEPLAEQWLVRLVTGDLRGTVAAQDELGRWSPTQPTTTTTTTAGAARLTGTSRHVVDAASADLLLVAAGTPDGVALFAVEADDPGCQVTSLSTMDLTRRPGVVLLDDAAGRLVVGPDRAGQVLTRVGDTAAVVLAAMQLGTAARLLELSVEHARTRYQFGRPIGSFQGVKHRCADVLVEVELARSTVLDAAAAADEDDAPRLPRAAALAALIAGEAAVHAGAAAVQVHGGQGFAWEHPVHLLYKRAIGDAALLGTSASHREQLARMVLDDEVARQVPLQEGAR